MKSLGEDHDPGIIKDPVLNQSPAKRKGLKIKDLIKKIITEGLVVSHWKRKVLITK